MALNGEEQIFGLENAFSDRWTEKHGIPKTVHPSMGSGLTKDFSPADTFSEILETGLTSQPQWYEVTAAIDSADSSTITDPTDSRAFGSTSELHKKDKNFKIAATNGLVRLLNVHGSMKSSRIDSVANSLKEGPTPQGIAQWLFVDDETRHSLAMMFELAGYAVADEVQVDDKGDPIRKVPGDVDIKGPVGAPSFADHQNLRPDQVKDYLKDIQNKIGTDWGVVRVAYTIFRIMGFPHENVKFSEELIGKYVHTPTNLKGDLEPKDVAPLLDRLKESTPEERKLKDVLEEDGMIGFAIALNGLQAEKIAREWADMNLILDAMDKINDIRKGVGGASTMEPEKRLQAISGVQELQVALAKRKFDDETAKRIFDPRKVDLTPPAAQRTFMERTMHGMKVPLAGFGSKYPTVKGPKDK